MSNLTTYYLFREAFIQRDGIVAGIPNGIVAGVPMNLYKRMVQQFTLAIKYDAGISSNWSSHKRFACSYFKLPPNVLTLSPEAVSIRAAQPLIALSLKILPFEAPSHVSASLCYKDPICTILHNRLALSVGSTFSYVSVACANPIHAEELPDKSSLVPVQPCEVIQEMDASALLQAIQLAMVRDERSMNFWKECASRALQLLRINQLSLKDGSMLLFTFYKSKANTDEIVEFATNKIQDEMKQIDGETLSMVLRSFVSTKHHNTEFYTYLIQELHDRTMQSRMSPIGITNLTWSYSSIIQLGLCGRNVNLLDTLQKAAYSNVDHFTITQLFDILQSFGKLAIRDEPKVEELLTRISQILLSKKTELYKSSLMSLIISVHGMAKCRVNNEELFRLVSTIWREKKMLKHMTTEQLCDLVYSYAKFRYIYTSILDELSVECRKRMRHLTFNQMSQILSSFGSSGTASPVLLKLFSAKIKKTNDLNDFADLSGIEVVNLANAFGKFSFSDSKLFQIFSNLLFLPSRSHQITKDGVTFYSSVRLHTLSIRDCVTIIRAWAAVHNRDDHLFENVTMILQRQLEADERMLTQHLLLTYMHACGKVGYRNFAFHPQVVKLLESRKFEDFNILEQLKLSTALQRLSLLSPSLVAHLNELLPDKSPSLEIDEPWKGLKAPFKAKRKEINLRKRKWTW